MCAVKKQQETWKHHKLACFIHGSEEEDPAVGV